MALQDSLCWFSGLNKFSMLSALPHSTKMFNMNICIRNSMEPHLFNQLYVVKFKRLNSSIVIEINKLALA
jgi:hypothetical protein